MRAVTLLLGCTLLLAVACGDDTGDTADTADTADSEQSTGDAPWGDVDVCSLLPAEAVSEALAEPGIGAGAERTPQPSVVGCMWGDPSAAYVDLRLWDPVDEQGFVDTFESDEQGEIAGRTTYVSGVTRYCDLVVDNTDHWVTVDVGVDPASATEVDACAAAEEVATIALSSPSLPTTAG